MYHYFFDLNEILIDRYPAKISKEILENKTNSKFVFIYSENYSGGKPKNIPDSSKVIYMPFITEKKLCRLFDQFEPSSMTTIAQRIPDLLMIFLSNKRNIPTNTVQHGIWSDQIKRISVLNSIMGKFSKIKFYLKNSYSLSKALRINYFVFLLDAYNFFYKDNKNISQFKSLSNPDLRAKRVFAFDPSWNNYYTEKFNYDLKNLVYIGNPDLLLLNNKSTLEMEDAVCYICQSLVEDGRYLLEDFIKFLNILKNNVASKKVLYVKLHPRTKLEYYETLKNVKNIIFTKDFPICKYYIGHYSSLLLVAKKVTTNVLIWKLKNHYTPQNFYQYSSLQTDSEKELETFIFNKEQTNNKNLIFNYESPYRLIAKKITKNEN